ncbi:MAG: flagellar protein FlgN [Eubacteriales bacterium]
MKNNITELIEILENQNKIYHALIDVSKEMKLYIEKNDVKELDMLVKVESALTMKFSLLENRRKSMSKNIRTEYDIPEDSFNMTELKKYLNKSEADKMEETQESLIKSMKELDEINSSNNMLVRSRLDWIDLSLKILGKNNSDKKYNKEKKIERETKLVDELI